MFEWFHKLGSPRTFFEFGGRWLPWVMAGAILLLGIGALWALLFVPPDYQQGQSVRIMYIHVPAAILAQSGYVMMAGAGAVFLIWRIKLADIAMQGVAPLGAAITFLALVTGSLWGETYLGYLVGLGCTTDINACTLFVICRTDCTSRSAWAAGECRKSLCDPGGCGCGKPAHYQVLGRLVVYAPSGQQFFDD